MHIPQADEQTIDLGDWKIRVLTNGVRINGRSWKPDAHGEYRCRGMRKSRVCKVSCFYYVEECAGNREPFLLVDVYVYNTLSRNPLAVCKPADGDHLDERLTISSDDLMWYVVATDHPTEDGVLSVIRVSPTGHEADVTIDMDNT